MRLCTVTLCDITYAQNKQICLKMEARQNIWPKYPNPEFVTFAKLWVTFCEGFSNLKICHNNEMGQNRRNRKFCLINILELKKLAVLTACSTQPVQVLYF